MKALTDMWCVYCVAELPVTFELGQNCPNCGALLDHEQKVCYVDHETKQEKLQREKLHEEN